MDKNDVIGEKKEGRRGFKTYFDCFRLKAIIFWSKSVGAMSLSLSL
jgi:hypothetical protein